MLLLRCFVLLILFPSIVVKAQVAEVPTHSASKVFVSQEDKEYIRFLEYAPDGKTFASWSVDGVLRLRAIDTGKSLWSHQIKVQMTKPIAFSADSKQLAVGQQSGGVVLLDTQTGKPGNPFLVSQKPVSGLIYLNPKQLLVGTGEGELLVWDIQKQQKLQSVKETYARELSLSPNGETLAFPSNEGIQLWDVAKLSKMRTLIDAKTTTQTKLHYLSDETLVGYLQGNNIAIWNIPKAKPLETIAGTAFTDFSHTLSMDRKTLLTRNVDDVDIWDISTGQLKGKLRQEDMGWEGVHRIDSAALSDDGSGVLLGTGEGEVVCFKLKKQATAASSLPQIESKTVNGLKYDYIPGAPEYRHIANSMGLTSNGKLLFLSHTNQVQVWNLKDRKLEKTIPPASKYRFGNPSGTVLNVITSITPSADGKLLLLGTTKETILWDVEKNQHRYVLKDAFNIESGSFSGDGKQFAFSSLADTEVYSTTEPKLLAKFPNSSGASTFVKNKYLIVAERNNRVKLWDLDTETKLAEHHPEMGILRVAQLFTNETKLFVAGEGGACIYNLNFEGEKASLTQQQLTTTETSLYNAGVSSDGKRVLLCGRSVKLLEETAPILNFPLPNAKAAVLSSDGQFAVIQVRDQESNGYYFWMIPTPMNGLRGEKK